MNFGALRHQVSIEETTLTTDLGGGATDSWAAITNGTVWASINQTRGDERYISQQLQEQVTHKILIRYLAGVDTKHTVLFGTRRFDILNVQLVREIRHMMIIFARERQSN